MVFEPLSASEMKSPQILKHVSRKEKVSSLLVAGSEFERVSLPSPSPRASVLRSSSGPPPLTGSCLFYNSFLLLLQTTN